MAGRDAMKRHLVRGVGRMSDLVMTKARGSFVEAEGGRRLLDMTTGIGVVNTGHCHPTVVEAAQAQCATLVHGQVNIAHHDKMLELTEVLLPVLPSGLDRLFYTNSGAEAVENAIKMARYATGRQNVVTMQGAYHGRTFATMAMTTSSRIYRQKFAPLVPGFYPSPFPYEHHGVSSDAAMKDLDLLMQQVLHPDEVAAVILEPVLGEGGYVPAPPDFIQRLKAFCHDMGALLIVDEVQTGFGRTGTYFACDSERYGNVSPDILVCAKGIASGFPLSAVATRAEISDKMDPGTMGGTYSGNAVACAAAIATQQVIRDEGLLENSRKMGERLRANLRDLQDKHPDLIADVRGLGCMVGMELHPDRAGPGTKAKLSQACLDRDMLILGCSVFETMRFIPPLTVSPGEIDRATDTVEKALADIGLV